MATNLKSVFKQECAHVKFDNRFLQRISTYAIAWANADDDRVAFLGGNLLGVHPIRFRSSDRDQWFDEVLEADDYSLRDQILSLSSIDPRFKVSTDVMNLSCLWLLHEIHNAAGVTPARKHAAMIDVLLVLHYKFISSLMAHNFRYPADKEVALATYAALSRKYALKQHGSWAALLRARSEDIISRKSIHYSTIVNFNDDDAIVYMINDIQGRLREVVKKMMVIFYRMREQGTRIGSASISVVDLEGELALRDLKRTQSTYLRYIKEIVGEKRDFIKDEIVHIVAGAMHTMPERLLVGTLEYMSANYARRETKVIDELVEETLFHAFDYLESSEGGINRLGDLASIISRLRALYMASRSSDPAVLRMRELAEGLVKRATKQRSPGVIAAVRTGVLIYIVLRALTKRHYGA